LFSFCRRQGIPCLDLLPALRRLGTRAFIDEDHLSAQGAKLVAEEVIRWGRTGCMMCGYDLIGVEAAQCPKCDHAIVR